MKLQFAFGASNPRKKRGKKRRKSIAKHKKSGKTRSVKAKFKKAGKMAKRHKRRLKRNPEAAVIRKGGKIMGREFSPLSKREADAAAGKFISLKKQYLAAPKASDRSALLKEMNAIKKKLGKRSSFLKTLERYAESADNKISKFELGQKGEKSMAKRRKKRKGGGKKASRRKKKIAAKKAAPKKRRSKRRKTKKSGKRRMSKAAKRAFVARMKKARKAKGGGKAKKRKSSKRRRRARMITHRHAASTRHLKKGTSFRFKAKSKRGKRRITVTGRVKINPFRRNPLKNMSAQTKKYMGLDAAELGSLALGGALVPIVNAGIGKIPGASSIVSKINDMVGPQAVGSVVPILAGVVLNAIAEHGVKSGQAHKGLKMAGEGLAAAGVIGLVMSLSQRYVAPALGLSGINYTPSMRGINYTPSMNGMGIMPQLNGINYTPSMGIMPQLNGMGASPDFGSANYGGGGGSKEARTQRADFGAWQSQDSEDGGYDEDNSYSSSMN